MKAKKIGSLEYKKFKTEFWITPKIEKYCKENKISEACFIPDGWIWYETQLFDLIGKNQDGISNKNFGKKFKTIYYGWTIKRNLNVKTNKLTEKNNIDKINFTKNKLIRNGEAFLGNNLGIFKAVILKK